MAYLIGTDEAGYGPNLGPLVVSATVWQIPDGPTTGRLAEIDLYQQLQPAVTREMPPRARAATEDQFNEAPHSVWIADSKEVYKPRGSLAPLEHGVLSALESCQVTPNDSYFERNGASHRCCERTLLRKKRAASADPLTTGASKVDGIEDTLGSWSQVWRRLDPAGLAQCRRAPWYQRAALRIPTAAGMAAVKRSADRLCSAYQATGCRLLDVHSAAVFPHRFNQLLDEHGNKSTLLSRVTLKLIDRAMSDLPREPTLIVCDKHGGRNKYAPLLQAQFSEGFVQVRHESRAESVYWQGPSAARREFRFRAGGESFLPSALASMTSKYLRELSMKLFNRYWQGKVPGIKPTAGYPLDARRFRDEIQVAQRQLQIADRTLWRER